jgi:hypothetical protein
LGEGEEPAASRDGPGGVNFRVIWRGNATPAGKQKAERFDVALGRAYFSELLIDVNILFERAIHLLKASNHSVDRIAGQVGHADGVTLRALLRRWLGKGMRELRSRECVQARRWTKSALTPSTII